MVEEYITFKAQFVLDVAFIIIYSLESFYFLLTQRSDFLTKVASFQFLLDIACILVPILVFVITPESCFAIPVSQYQFENSREH